MMPRILPKPPQEGQQGQKGTECPRVTPYKTVFALTKAKSLISGDAKTSPLKATLEGTATVTRKLLSVGALWCRF